jgi:hypothetical protein
MKIIKALMKWMGLIEKKKSKAGRPLGSKNKKKKPAWTYYARQKASRQKKEWWANKRANAFVATVETEIHTNGQEPVNQ